MLTRAWAVCKEEKIARSGILGHMAIFDGKEAAEIKATRHDGECVQPVIILDEKAVNGVIGKIGILADSFGMDSQTVASAISIIRRELTDGK